jgi:hypothetical protein
MTVDQKATGMGAVVRRSVTHTMTKGRFAGRPFELMALGIRDLVQCQEECVEDHKRAYLQTYTRNVDLMPAELRKQMIEDAFVAAAAISYEDLPVKLINMPIIENGKVITGENGKPLTRQMKVEYAMWWVGEAMKGKLYSAWLAMRKCQGQGDITLNDADDIFVDSMGDLNEAVEKLGRATNPRVLGNDEAPAADVGQPARETRQERRARIRSERARANLLTGR